MGLPSVWHCKYFAHEPANCFEGHTLYPKRNTQKYRKLWRASIWSIYRNNLLGLDEMIKKLWMIVDSPKTDTKQKIKSIMLIWQYCKEKV
jgi:hypothetical protein